jgi:hypothetical protein
MTEQAPPLYLDAHGWAKLLAYLWTRPKFAHEFEADPVQAILNAQADTNSIELDFVFMEDQPAPRTRLLRLPPNPGYSLEELNDAVIGLVPIVPVTSWMIHGVAA